MTDQSKKGMEIIRTIHDVSKELVMAEHVGAVQNRVLHPEKIDYDKIGDIPLVAVIGPDDVLVEHDIEGLSTFSLPEDAGILKGAREILKKMEIIG